MPLDLQRAWFDQAILAIDFETDGPNPDECMPVEVAAIRFEAGNITGRFATFLNPGRPINPDSTKVHGITDADVANAPKLEDVLHEIAALSVDAVPAAYHSDFDRAVLHRFATGNDVTAFDPEQEWLCGLVMASSEKQDKYVSGKGRLRLSEVAKRHGISVGTSHRAEADAVAAGKLIYHFMGDKRPELGRLLDRMKAARLEREEDWRQFQKRVRAENRGIWRVYAAAALSGYTAREQSMDRQNGADCAREAALAADALLKLEQERFFVRSTAAHGERLATPVSADS